MKTLKKPLYSFLLLLLFIACTYDDSPLDEDIVASNTGAVLTTVSKTGDTIDKSNLSDSSLQVRVLFNDFKNNDTMESVNLYLLFADTTPVDNEILEIDEVLIETISPSAFTEGESGFPEHQYSISAESMLDKIGLEVNQIETGDLFILRYSLNLADGRVFSTSNTGNNVRTTSHNTPFRYSLEVE